MLLWVVLYSSAILLFRKYIPQLGNRFLPFMVYPAILLGMLSLALPFMLHNTGSWLICRRSSPFFCSGLLLAHNLTTKNRPTAKPSGYATGTNLLFSYSRLAYFIDKFHISGT
ncbi:hypothetical protein DPQ25_01340 [Hydrogeniiclostridium mannosilyticum]|uniref:Uncharacterized protein n=1 Tax=Hydrogeniiclostridium mannosilyticum TaxID=2764322 RepID=A0A328UIX5_9FIRM|nr:hypothetical protein DPQ25_01340 [Hydrogeniiclostridium mannosilyticum]